MKDVILMCNKGKMIKVEFNPNSYAIKTNGAKYIEILARTKVPIDVVKSKQVLRETKDLKP